MGIAKDILPKLFNKFTRAPNANEVNVMGSGLGLYVAGEMTKAHNGKIWAESEGAGLGSTFFIELPQNKEKEHEETINTFAQAI
jgi:histidine kinase